MGESSSRRKIDGFVAAALYGSVITGVLGLLGAATAFSSGSWSGVGGCLVASALAFGLLGAGLLRG